MLTFTVWNLSTDVRNQQNTSSLLTQGLEDNQVTANVTSATTSETVVLPYVRIKNSTFFVEIAKTDVERGRGLSGRSSLPENAGMLFVFDAPGLYGFWMYGMHFSIDIIWISEEGRVVYIVEKAPPCQPDATCEVFRPQEEAKYVLEVNAGVCEKLGLKVGDLVEFWPGLTD